MIKFLTKTALVATMLAATPAFAQAVNPATADGEARVRILQPLVLDATDGILDFGVLVKAGATTGTYTYSVSTAGVAGTCPTDWACSAPKQAAGFTVTGAPDESVQVTVQTTPVDLNGPATEVLEVSLRLQGDTDLNGISSFALAPVTGIATFAVGGVLSVGGDVATGVYAAPFTVSAEYL